MVTASIFLASIVAGLDLTQSRTSAGSSLILAMALLLTFLLNTILLQAPVRAVRAAGGDDGAGRPLAPRPAARARHSSCRRTRRRPAAGGRLQPHAGAARARAPALGRAGPAGTGGGAQARRARPARRGQPVADRAAAADRRRSPRTRRPSCASSSTRPSASRTGRWASCSTSRASCARPRSTTTGWSRRSRPTSSEYDRRGDASAHFWADPAVDEPRARRRRPGGRLPRRPGGARQRRRATPARAGSR